MTVSRPSRLRLIIASLPLLVVVTVQLGCDIAGHHQPWPRVPTMFGAGVVTMWLANGSAGLLPVTTPPRFRDVEPMSTPAFLLMAALFTGFLVGGSLLLGNRTSVEQRCLDISDGVIALVLVGSWFASNRLPGKPRQSVSGGSASSKPASHPSRSSASL